MEIKETEKFDFELKRQNVKLDQYGYGKKNERKHYIETRPLNIHLQNESWHLYYNE